MKVKLAALTMAALLALYLGVVVQYGLLLLGTDLLVARVMGVALLVLPLVGVWALVAELVFVVRAERLLARLGAEGGLPADDLPRLPSGRPDPKAADERFPEFRRAVEAHPDSWQDWLRLALAYDASGDRKRARWATRQAIRLSSRPGSLRG